jgi:hypothetical protein
VANVSTEGGRVNANPPGADYGSNRHVTASEQGFQLLAPAKSRFSGVGRPRSGRLRGWFGTLELDRPGPARFGGSRQTGLWERRMACSCHEIGTKVECTLLRLGRIFSVSRPGGGLFGRPTTRESLGRFLFVGVFSAVLIPRRERPAHAGVTRSQTSFCERWRFALATNPTLIRKHFFLKRARIEVLPPSHCISPHERSARVYICTKACTLHRPRLGYDVRPREAG